MRALVSLVLLLASLAGCLAPAAEPEPAAAKSSPSVPLPEPVILEFRGHVVHSEIDGPSHARPTEDLLWPIQQEGFLADIAELPQAMEVYLEWTGHKDAEFLIMLHSHKAEGTNAYVEHVSDMSTENPKCIRVPTADLATGHWQVMVHTEKAMDADWTLKVGLFGGRGEVVTDDLHGHWLQDGGFEVEEHEPEPCSLLQAAGA